MAYVPVSNCSAVMFVLCGISSSDCRGVSLSKGKGDHDVFVEGWGGGAADGHCFVNLACAEGQRTVESPWRKMLTSQADIKFNIGS